MANLCIQTNNADSDQTAPRTNSVDSDQTARSSLTWVHTVCPSDVLNGLADDASDDIAADEFMNGTQCHHDVSFFPNKHHMF